MYGLSSLVRLFNGAVAANLIMLVVIVRAHAGYFSLLMDPFSWLGKLVAAEGLANTGAFLLFSATLLLNAIIWIRMLSLMALCRIGRHPAFLLIGRLVLVGFALMAFPCDRFVTTHSIGAGFVVGGLWAITAAMLYFTRYRLGRRVHLGMQIILHLAALFCGVNFVFDTLLKGFSQRPLLLAILTEAGICLNKLVRAYQESGAIAFLENPQAHSH